MTRALTLGTFDCLHAGHVRLLKRAAGYGSLTVGVNSDEFVTRYKGEPPIQSYLARHDAIQALPCVEEVYINRDPGHSLIRIHRPDILVVGSDWLAGNYLQQINLTHTDLVDLDLEIVFVPRTPGVSSSERRAQLLRDRGIAWQPGDAPQSVVGSLVADTAA